MGRGNELHTIVDDRDLDDFNIDDNEIEDYLADFDMEHGITSKDIGNVDIDYYPGMRGGRHAFLGEPEDVKSKFIRNIRKVFAALTSYKTRKLLIGAVGFILVLIFFAILLFTGSGNDADLPGGAIHEGKDPTDNFQSSPQGDNLDQSDGDGSDDVSFQLEKMSLDEMRRGSYWVFDTAFEFFAYEEISEVAKRHADDHGDKDDDEDEVDDNEVDHEKEKEQEVKKKTDNKSNKKQEGSTEELDTPDLTATSSDDQGYYIEEKEEIVVLKKAADSGFSKQIIDLSKLVYNDEALHASIVSLTKSLDKAIVSSEKRQHWRHSSVAKYWLVDTKSLQVQPLHYITRKEGENDVITPVLLAYAAFSSDGKHIYYHYNGNIFLKNVQSGNIEQITTDGDTKNIFNAKPDWVYEEEVLASDRAIYWETKGEKFAFIRWDDSDVPVYNLEVFGTDDYPEIDELKYPKAGFPNARLSLFVYDISKSKLIKIKQPEEQDPSAESLGADFVIYQTVWLNEEELLFKRTDRTSRKIQVCCFNLKTGKTSVVRSINTDTYSGWYKNNGNIFVLPENKGYIDTVVVDDHDHLSYFKGSDDAEGELITSGDWNVIGGVTGYYEAEDTIYFVGTHGNALQRQIYKVRLGESALFGLTDLDDIHSYSLKTSSGGKWGVVKYSGPELPYQKLVDLTKFTDENYIESIPNLNNADQVEDLLKHLEVPYKQYIPFKTNDGVDINVIEVKPKNFDESKKYPILVSVYGGPGIQKVSCDFSYGFEEIVSSALDAIVLYIDPRGTGGSSWKYRSWARNNIGYWEPRDIVETTQNYISDRDYVDTEKVAIWGWSYGGFTTLKTLEFDHGMTFKYGMAVAPVTNWHLYDSIYTERYMGFPSKNNEYKDAKITEYKNFKDINRFLVMHGTADDNVHYQNTLQLLNQFDIDGVENYDVHVFTDSDHNIAHQNANTIVYDKLFNWLSIAFDV